MKYLDYDSFLEVGENLSCGEKIRVNHQSDECSGGSNSLLIERKDDGTISAYCFRCGKSGYRGTNTLKSKSAGSDEYHPVSATKRQHTIPGDCESSIEEWPVKARVWVRKYGITDEEVLKYGICYSNHLGRVVLPVYDGDGLASYQTRRIHAADIAPKYLTFRNRDAAVVYDNVTIHTIYSSSIVLVEDMLSAIKVSRILPAMPLFGTSIKHYQLDFLINQGYNTFILFFDDDNMTVKEQTLKSKRLLDKIGSCTIHHSEGKDPKEHTEKELRAILT